MNPTVIQGALGDNPPKATLYYGQSALDTFRQLPSNSVSMICTSPPYWGLRDYGTPPQVWGGDRDCEHEWGASIEMPGQSGGTGKSTLGTASGGNDISEDGVLRSQLRSQAASSSSAFCVKCNAWRGQLGLEPTHLLFVEHLVEVFREARRVLHPSGTFWLNLGDSYMSHVARDTTNLGGREGERQSTEDGYGESIIIGKPKVEGLKDKDLVGIPWRVALALQDDGWWLRNAIIWHKTNAMPHSVTDRFTCKYEQVFLFAKQARYFFDLDAVRVPHTYGHYDKNGNFSPAQNWFEEGEGSRKMDQTEGQLGSLAGSPRRFGRGVFNTVGKNPGDMWSIATAQYKGAHFAVWPTELVERMVKAGASERGRCPTCKAPWRRVTRSESDINERHTQGLPGNDTSWEPTCDCPAHDPERCVVLDPFSGSATTGKVAMDLNRDYVGLDLNADYLPLATARLRNMPAPKPKQANGTAENLIDDLFA